MEKINILVVDDHPFVAKGYCQLLQQEPFVESTCQAQNQEEFRQALANHRIDVILLDMKLKDISGLELLDDLKHVTPRPHVIAVTALDGTELIINMLRAGIEGVVYKVDDYSVLLKTITGVLRTGSYFSESVRDVMKHNLRRWNDIPSVVLTPREKDLLKALASGLTTAEIAPLLKMGYAYAEKCRKELMKKLGVPNSAALLAFAFRNGIL